MRLFVSPGRRLQFVAELALEGLEHDLLVVDCESGKSLTLAELLRAFREDAGEPELGWVRITIEPYDRPRPRRAG